MPTLETFAARFARCVSLFRDPAAKDEQKAEFRALLGLLHDVAVTLRVSAGRLEVNGTPAGGGGGGVVGLLQRLDLHGISEIALPRGRARTTRRTRRRRRGSPGRPLRPPRLGGATRGLRPPPRAPRPPPRRRGPPRPRALGGPHQQPRGRAPSRGAQRPAANARDD